VCRHEGPIVSLSHEPSLRSVGPDLAEAVRELTTLLIELVVVWSGPTRFRGSRQDRERSRTARLTRPKDSILKRPERDASAIEREPFE
jgi:hypothetical protein